ncbi:MAG: carbohydrate-binding domain-containing protein [Clostridiales Family XIII bacterium]|jgi:hypothetical protein|nr:carbohydrate-binding domain-containing protein [Clostridiales Family XIII bacterium]
MRRIKCKFTTFSALFLALTIALAGCGSSGASQSGLLTEGSVSTLINTSEFTCVYEYAPEDTDASWDATLAATVVFDGDTAQVSGSGAAFADAALTIKQAGTYVLSGLLSNGRIVIDAGKNDLVRLVLNNVSLHNEAGPAIYAPQSEKVVLILGSATENTISDGAGYGETADEPDAAIFVQDNLSITGNGVLTVNGNSKHGIRAQDALVVTDGTLNINAVGDAIRGRDGVAIQNGSFTLNADGDGIQSNNDEDAAKGFVIINGGAYTITAQNDGIQAQSALTITDGNLQITSGGGSANAPALEAGSRGTWGGMPGGGDWSAGRTSGGGIDGGVPTNPRGDAPDGAPGGGRPPGGGWDSDRTSGGGIGGGVPGSGAPDGTPGAGRPPGDGSGWVGDRATSGGGIGGGVSESGAPDGVPGGGRPPGGGWEDAPAGDPRASTAAPSNTSGDPAAAGGDPAGAVAEGSEAEVAAEDESISRKALKAGKLICITGGEISIDAEDDAVHSNDNLIVTSGKLSIQTGDDGLHADSLLEISGGEINIPVCYEGIEGLSVTISGGDININANDDAINAAGGADSAPGGGTARAQDRFSSNGDIFVRISGGTLDLLASYDGIDANGNIFFEGGAVKISGPSQGMDGAIDLDGTMLVSGGEFIAAGSVMNVSGESTQPVILVSYSQRQASGSVIAIKNANGETLLEYTSKTDYTMSGFTSPSFKIGETYSLFIDGEKKTEITLENIINSTADDGSEYNGGRGAGRGNWGGEMPPGARGGGDRPSGETLIEG